MTISRLVNRFLNSYILVVLAALALGIFFSKSVVFLASLSTIFLAIIFFLSSLKIDLSKIKEESSNFMTVFVVNLVMLFALPVAVYFLMDNFYPALLIPFFILAVMPSGMTSPLLSEIVGGKQSLALLLTISTSLLAPFTVPFMIKAFIGAEVSVDFWGMFSTLATVIYIPFFLAQILKHFKRPLIEKISPSFKPISVFILGCLITGVVARQSDAIIRGFENGGELLFYLLALFVFFAFLHLIGYFTAFWRSHEDKVTVTVCITYMNFTLAIELANKFFPDPHILIPIILSVIPWAILLSPFGALVKNLSKR